MGYDFFASGVMITSNGPISFPNVNQSNRIWGDEWDLDTMTKLMLKMRGLPTGTSITGGLTIGLLRGYAISTFKRLMGQTLQMMAINNSHGTISIYTRDANLIMPDRVGFRRFRFRGDVEPEFRRMLRYMDEVELNYMGPLMDMLNTLSRWNPGAHSGNYLLSFDFRWS